MMKKFIAGLILSSVTAYWASFALNIPVTELQSTTTSCNSSETANVYYYLSSNWLSTNPSDTFWNTVDSLIWWGNNGSSIDIWRNGVISSCNTWERVSNVVSSSDSNGALVFLNTDNCVFKIPSYTKTSNPTAIDAQIHYSVWYRKIFDNWPNTSTAKFYYRDYWANNWTCYPNGNTVSDYSSCAESTVKYWVVNTHVWECINYHVFRCGDGLVNSPIWTRYDNKTYTEECDPASPDWKNRTDWKSCNASCKIEYQASSCGTLNWNTAYNSNYSSPRITETSSGLCGVWKLVAWSFSYNKDTWKYTWSCQNGGATAIACNAQDLWCGDWKVQSSYEACDPEDSTQAWWKEWSWKTCNGSCKIEDIPRTGPVCSSTYSKKTEYTSTSAAWLSSSNKLCDVWSLVSWSFNYSGTPRTFTWKCTNDWLSVDCTAYQQWCGDWKKNGNEVCDPQDGSHTWRWDGCSASCDKATYDKWVCGSTYHTKKKYMSIDTDRITQYTQWLCDKWTVTSFKKHTSSPIYTWQCNNNWNISDTCRADQEWCGDWVKNGSEACDDGSKNGTSSSSCSATCTTVSGVSCGTQNGWTKYFSSKQTSPWLTKTSNWMCAAWLTVGNPEIKWTDSHLEWTCSNANGSSTTCKAYQEYCGDWVKNGSETCDEGSKNGTSSSSCSATCTAVSSVSCGTKDKWTTYFTSRQTSAWLTRTTAWMCAAWLTVGDPEVKWLDSHLEWTCSNANGSSTTCKAYQEYCGDEILQSDHEECDYNDGKETNWWNDGCDTECKQKNVVSDECDDTFYYTIRHKWQYTFYDRFDPRGATRYLYDFDVDFVEKSPYDYNRWANPTFNWSGSLENGIYMPVSSKKTVIWSTPLYQVLDHPAVRSKDNLYIEYNIKYADKAYSSRPSDSQLKTHKECVYYEISRCGDGIIDTDYNEVCDPGDSSHTNWWNGWCDKDSCKPIDVVAPECNSDYNWKRVSNLENWSYLCIVWTPTGFDYDESTHKWTWSCDNEAWTQSCYAIKPYCGDGVLDEWEQCDYNDKNHTNWWNWTCNKSCQLEYPSWTAVIQKTLKDKIPVDHTWQDLAWIVKVTAKWWDISNFEIWDKMPIELDYVDYNFDSANSQNWITVTYDDERSPVRSWNVNIHYWDVKWTLKEWNSIIIVVNTKVNKMPKTWEDILNIACVIKDNKELDCGEDKPPVKDGELEVIKTLISKDKYVTHTWQELEWSITVRAKNWDVKMESIRDVLPEELAYSGYKKEYIPSWITIEEPKLSNNDKEITWKTTWTLKSWDYIELHVITTVIKMPQKTVKNVACAKPENWQEECNPWYTHDLRIRKYVWDKQSNKRDDDVMTWTVWETIKYKIEFGNNGDESVRVRIKDYLPKWVRFISGTLVVWKQTSGWWVGTWKFDMMYKWTQYNIDGVTINSYESIFLNGGEQWVLTIEGEILNDTKNTTNFVCIFDENSENKDPIACDDAHHNIEEKEMECKNLVIPSWELPNDWWTKAVTCTASKNADLITIDCWEWAKWNRYITWSNTSEVSGTCSYNAWAHTYSVNCKVEDGGKTYTSNSCKWSVVVKGSSSWCFPAGTKITMADGTTKNIEDVNEWDEVLSYNTNTNVNEWNVVKQKFVHIDHVHEMYELTINGEVLKVTDVHPFYVKKVDSSKGYDWVDAQYLKVGDVLLMIDGSLVTIEEINHYSDQETVYNLEVEGNHDYYVDRWYLVHNKWWCRVNCDPTPYCEKHPNDAVCMFANPKCFNVNNWNISVELWEFLPVYINLEKENSDQNPYNYIVYKESEYPLWEDNINDMLGKECEDGDVALNSIMCLYIIKNSSGIVYTETHPCLDGGESKDGSPLVKRWAEWQKDQYGRLQTYVRWTTYTYYPQVYLLDTAKIKAKIGGRLWEYQYQVEVIDYAQCMGGERKSSREENGGQAGPVCQNNFVLTEPYTVQKTPSWNLTASIETLFKFKEANGLAPFSRYLVDVISTSNYEPNNKVDDAMKNFINKYEKLAVTVKDEGWKTLKKVPWKNIYFVKWEIDPSKITKLDKPITIVQTDWDTIINWNINYNIMVLTKWNIRFRWSCTSNQTVKWIFYAAGDLVRENVKKNTKTSNDEWCDKWWLYVKGVLIWHNFDNLMRLSRSHLENWFTASTPADKKWEIMKWWSVVIEYSPSVFTKSSMPPGAEDFTTALSIYKQ